ncbi:hypothetical protein [Phytohabitans rumicis]|uniref:hypothetical protein n=1 Tax=Phytohabitans rumicis TaxID=1076125 RepID=UPI0015B632FD|nr:hypothetical protein [Phytohabitans rumicis]
MAVALADGREFTARYAVDACGVDSPLRAGLGPGRGGATDPLLLRSRLLSGQLRGVTPLEGCLDVAGYPGATAWSKGTIHHLFPGGWIQVVDHGNHDGSVHPVCGVTVGVDPHRFADLPADAAAAFKALVATLPSVAEQFAGAEAVGPWVGGDPWQRLPAATYGDRWFAMERAACRTDDFLSRDATMGAEIVHALAAALLRIVQDGAPAGEQFARVAAYQGELIAFNDRMLAAARTACDDFRLFNAFTRVWLLWQILAHLSLKRATADALAVGSWAPVERFAGGALWFDTPDGLGRLLDDFFARFAAVRAGRLAPGAAAAGIFQALRRAKFAPPLYAFGDPKARYYHFTMLRRLLMVAWVSTIAPRDFKRLLTRDNVTGRRRPPAGRGAETTERGIRMGAVQ